MASRTYPTPESLIGVPGTHDGPWFSGGRRLGATEGWKLYISTTILTHVPVLRAAAAVLERAPDFKYVADEHHLRTLNAGSYGYSQIGKCVVVYLPTVDESLVGELIGAVGEFRGTGPRVPFASRFGDDLPLSYRYGSFAGDTIRPRGVDVPDPRLVPDAAVPDGVEDELGRFTRPDQPDEALRSFLLRYPPFEAIQQQGKGGIFRSLDLGSPVYREVVIKVGYPRGQVQPDGSDGRDMVRREAAFYRALAEQGLGHMAPTLVDVHAGLHTAIVLEDVTGPTLLASLLAGELTVPTLQACIEVLDSLHRAGLFLGDAKLANFVSRASDGAVLAVDFETAGVVGVDPVLPVRTFQLDNPHPATVQQADLWHLLASVLFPYENGRYGLEDRRVDLRGAARDQDHHQGEVRQWAAQRLRKELETVPA